MLANPQSRTERRGIVLVLVLAMLGLLALVGVTFATFSGQSRINSRNFAQSLIQPQDDELMDFALGQLINDTGDPRSVIHGHSLARDMYGNDAFFNGFLPMHLTNGGPFFITAISAPTNGFYTLTTNIASNDYNFYGFNFKRWIIRVIGTTANGVAGTVSQTFEVLNDTQFSTLATAPAFRQFTVVIGPTDGQLIYTLSNTNQYVPVTTGGTIGTSLYNPNQAQTTNLPGQALAVAAAASTTGSSGLSIPFQLDGRWLHAFGGPGMGANAPLANFRYNGLTPGSVGMDEDYDACDLENWFLAIQSADGQVMIPSFHRPANIRYDINNPTAALQVNDWARINTDGPNGTSVWSTSASRILRPVKADGHDPTAFPDLTPDPNTGKITYDVDNDGDGTTDSVWLDLGYPARRDSRGQLYKPMFAFMVIGLNGRIPLNTAGNLASNLAQAEHLGNSVSEVDPTYGLQNAYTANVATDFDPFNQFGTNFAPGTYPAGTGTGIWGPTTNTNNGQVDNAVLFNTTLGANASEGVDVRLTQLRNLLAGTRPQPIPVPNGVAQFPAATDPTGAINGDDNSVFGNWAGIAGQDYFMPNGISDFSDIPIFTDGATPPNLYVQRKFAPVPGRWGEAQSIPGYPFANPNGPPAFNLVQSSYINPVRAGYSFDVSDFMTSAASATYGTTMFPRDAADDNNNTFDTFPPRPGTTNPPAATTDLPIGEVGDADYYDVAGALLLPVERMRRWVTPADINGTGRVVQWNVTPPTGGPSIGRGAFLGADNFGRVQYSSYFRPAGSPGTINVKYTYAAGTETPVVASSTLGAIYFPTVPATPTALGTLGYYGGGANPVNPIGAAGTPTPAATAYPNYAPDTTNNPFHGFEAYKIPNLFQNPGGTLGSNYNPQSFGGMPIDQGTLFASNPGLSTNLPTGGTSPAINFTAPTGGAAATSPNVPATLATYDSKANQSDRSDGLNEADETNLYNPNPLLDSPYGPSDLEWLYRQDDIDGSTLTSRLSQLAPISFTNTIDGQRRRRLYALDSWEMNNFVWANDNPGGAFANNARFTTAQSASFSTLSTNLSTPTNPVVLGTPTLAQRDKKINLNYPLPVSNDPNEPIRQKWINDTYQTLKWTLPPDSVDTAEELAQLSQFVINIVDFRDPDGTMTHWVNPDIVIVPGTPFVPAAGLVPAVMPTPASLYLNTATLPTGAVSSSLDQYGMEYNPVAINEALAYSFTSNPTAGASQTNRFFIELVNTLPAAYNSGYDYSGASATNNYYGNASALTLGGFNYTAGDPYSGGCWDLVFAMDDPMSRPDPYRGELVVPNATYSAVGNPASTINYFGLIPLNRETFTAGGNPALVNDGDVTLLPVNPAATSPNFPLSGTTTPAGSAYFYVIGNPPSTADLLGTGGGGTTSTTESSPPSTTATPITTNAGIVGGPQLVQQMLPAFDPLASSGTPPTFPWYPGILPGSTAAGAPANYSPKLPVSNPALPNFTNFPPSTTTGARGAANYWVCLRRPANPFAPVSATNPMCVVDSMRIPYIEGTGGTNANNVTVGANTVSYTTGTYNTIYSAQRLQPYRGGHAVAAPNAVPIPAGTPVTLAGAGGGTPPVATTTTVTTGATLTMQPPDPRYGYTEQLAVPATNSTNYGYYFNSAAAGIYPATKVMFHTLGAPNDSAENWDYLVFNDRDFTSVAELTLVPGCPPGLFTKQFAEFAPSQINAANIFATVTPIITPTFQSSDAGANPPPANSAAVPNPTTTVTTTGPSTTIVTGLPFLFTTATAPFLTISQATPAPTTALTASTATPPTLATPTFPTFTTANPAVSPAVSLIQPTTGIISPVQPHSFPYLVDKFFYTGASSFYYPPTGIGTDPSTAATPIPVVGGPASDGWFKMFDFFEVPSQMIGSIGPVAQGTNFDWARQDIKPGLLNVNLIIDEEVFFSVFGRQDGSLNQTLLNSIELPLLTLNGTTLPYSLPLSSNNTGLPPIPAGGPPVPLVVSAITASGAPNYVYPITNQTDSVQSAQQGFLLKNDPIFTAINTAAVANGSALTALNPPVGNRLKAAFAQFLWLRHGGSGYMFGYGTGGTGQNSAVVIPSLSLGTNPVGYAGALPAERYFHSLSYPDINYTIMRPAALPPSLVSMPAMVPESTSTLPVVVANAQSLLYQPTAAPTSGNWFFSNGVVSPTNLPNFYAPYCPGSGAGSGVGIDNFAAGVPVVYSGDPGVRNPWLSQGYSSSGGASPYTVQTTGFGVAPTTNTVPLGIPLPVNVAFPSGSATTPVVPLMDSVAMPPPIPPRRLFQPPDAYGSTTTIISSTYTGTTTLVPAMSNASDSGDPWINNQIPNPPTQAESPTVPIYTLNNGFSNLDWSGGTLYNPTTATPPVPAPLPATGALPLVSTAYHPYTMTTIPANLTNLKFTSNSATAPTSTTRVYLGTASASGNTDDRQHPYFRSESLQKAMNLTTVRTHQYAVWITVGFFEITKQGDIGMLLQGNPTAAYDVLGAEVGSVTGNNVRYRGFFLIDRTKLTGFNPNNISSFRQAVVYRKVIQ